MGKIKKLIVDKLKGNKKEYIEKLKTIFKIIAVIVVFLIYYYIAFTPFGRDITRYLFEQLMLIFRNIAIFWAILGSFYYAGKYIKAYWKKFKAVLKELLEKNKNKSDKD